MSDNQPSNDPTQGGWPAAPGATPSPPPSYPPPGGYAPPPAAGYPQGSVPPPGYGYGYAGGGYGYPVGRDHPQGTTILVLGIIGLVACQILGPVAWIMGSKAIKEIDANPSAYTNRGNVQAGRILGIISSVILILVLGFYAVLFVGLAVSSSSS